MLAEPKVLPLTLTSSPSHNKRVHFLVPREWGWIVPYAADRLMEGLRARGYEVSEGEDYDLLADLNYSATWHPICLKPDPPYPTVTLFTHFNAIDPGWYAEQLKIPHHIVTQTKFAKNQLVRERGIPEEKITPIYFGNDDFTPPDSPPQNPKIVVCASGRGYNNGRKRQWLPVDVSWMTDLSKFHFVFFGPKNTGWELTADYLSRQGLSAQCFPDLEFEMEPVLLRQVDFYLCTAFAEGGPIGALNAMGCGVPVISPFYGYPADFGAYEFYNSAEDLAEIFSDIATLPNPLPRRKPVRTSWEHDWVDGHERLFKKIWEGS